MATLVWDSVNNVWKGTFTVSNDGTGNSNETYTIDLGDMVAPVTVTLNGIDTVLYPGATNSINVTDCSTWNLTATPTTVTEGNTVTLSLSTSGVTDRSVPFSITGLQSGDLDVSTGFVSWDGSKYVGSFNLVNNASSPNLTLNVLNDNISDDGEVMTISLDNGNDSVNVTINDLPVTASCGDVVPDWNDGTSKSIKTSGDPQVIVPLSNYNTTGFENGGTLYLPQLSNSAANDSMFVSIPIDPNSPTLGLITWTLSPSDGNSTFFYEDLNGDCWQGNLLGTSPSTLTKL